MPTLSLTKTYADGDVLLESDLDNIRDGMLTFLNTTKIDSDNIQDAGISLAKLAATVQAALVPAGTIHAYGGVSAPTGFLLCDGTAVSRTTYSALFAIVGESFGQGDNVTTFNLPDFRGRFLRGWDNGAGRDPDAAGRTAMATGGNTGDNVGSIQADATEVNGLLNNSNPGIAVTSTGSTSSDGAHTHTAVGTTSTESVAGGATTVGVSGSVSTSSNGAHTHTVSVSGTTASHTHTIVSTDAETRPLNAAVNYIIKY